MRERSYIPLKVQLAAALLQLPGDDPDRPAVPYEAGKIMSPDQIIGLFELDHWPIPKAEDGPDEPWNLHWRLTAAHRAKTAKVDIPTIAKTKRLAKKEVARLAQMLNAEIDSTIEKAKLHAGWRSGKIPDHTPKPKRRIPSRSFQKGKRAFQKRRKP